MTVIVGSGQGGEKKKRLLLVVGVAGILLLAGGAGVGLRWWQNRDDKPAETTTKGSGFSSDVDDIQSLRAKGDLEGANARIEQALKDPNVSDEEHYNLYIQQGNAAVDRQDYAAAIAAYEQAEDIEENYETALLLADTWVMTNKAKALEYYKKALEIVPDGPIQEDNKHVIRQIIKNLEAES